MRRLSPARGFTLVELLVVIGIIALLISILLPSLSAARRQANTVKCATQLRDLGNAFKFYAIDNRNFYPPTILTVPTSDAATYEMDGVIYPVKLVGGTRTYSCYWFNFLNKYITKTLVGSGTTSVQNTADARKSILWGCNQFDGYNTTGLGIAADLNPVQTGYGMNPVPYFTPQGGSSTPSAIAPLTNASLAIGGGFIKANQWGKLSAARCLLMDSALYQTNANKSPTDGSVGLFAGDQNVTVDDSAAHAATAASVWRHGKHPTGGPTLSNYSNNCWYPTAKDGKVAFNILYADGHVVTESDPKLAYSTVRMKFPG